MACVREPVVITILDDFFLAYAHRPTHTALTDVHWHSRLSPAVRALSRQYRKIYNLPVPRGYAPRRLETTMHVDVLNG